MANFQITTTEDLLKRIGENIKRIRLEKEKNQIDIAYPAKLTTSIISNLENGKTNGASIDTLNKIANALEVDFGELLTNG